MLQKRGVTDEELMEHINIAEPEETERKNNFGATSQKSAPKVNQVEAENVRESVSPFRKPVAKRNRNTTTYKPATRFRKRRVCGACLRRKTKISVTTASFVAQAAILHVDVAQGLPRTNKTEGGYNRGAGSSCRPSLKVPYLCLL